MAERCPVCRGYGHSPGKPPCEKCGGTGYLKTEGSNACDKPHA